MLQVKNISIEINGKPILKDVTITIRPGQVMVLFGPNGSGKSTLLKSLVGFSGYAVQKGTIEFKSKDITNLPIESRVALGMGLMYQHPPKIRGVRLGQIASFLCKDEKKVNELAGQLSLTGHLAREINYGFSGGEMKRSELFQLLLQDPDLLLLDEPESGVDIENISLMGRTLQAYLERPGKSALIITHTGYILDYIKSENGCVMMDGKFWCVGNPKEMFESIKETGYEKCKVCACPQKT